MQVIHAVTHIPVAHIFHMWKGKMRRLTRREVKEIQEFFGT
jgi:hypothetical protein